MHITEKTIADLTLPVGKREAIFFDDDLPGFGLRLRAGGASRWIFQYKIGTQHCRVTLGTLAVPVAQARKTAGKLHAQIRLGRDPQAEKEAGRARADETMLAQAEPYLAHKRSCTKPNTYAEVERYLLKYCKALHTTPLIKIDRRAVAGALTKVATKNGPVAANRTRAALHAFFAWAIGEGLIDHNPVIGTNRRPEQSRSRVLSPAELKTIWSATAGDDEYSATIRLLMLTGCRAAEIAGLRWSEVDFATGTITLPPARTKNVREHRIPMSAPVRAIIENRPRRAGRNFIFSRQRDVPLSGRSTFKLALDRRIRDSGVEVAPWTHHDVRRTFATYLAERGVAPPHIIEALLNHVSGHKAGVAGVYNRAPYEPQKRQTLSLWAEHLMAIVEGRESKVVPMRTA